MSKEEFLEGMTFLGLAYNKEFTKEEIEVWYSMLCGYSKKEFSDSIKRLVKTLKRIPTIADITEDITNNKVSTISTAEDEWQNVLNAVRMYGSYREQEALESLKPYTAKIVKYIGYYRICISTQDEQVWNKKEFVSEYNSLVDKDILALQQGKEEQVMLNG